MVNRVSFQAGMLAVLFSLSISLLWVQTAQGQNRGQGGANADPNPNRPRLSDGAPQQPISIQYDEQPLLEVLKNIGALTGRNFEVDPQLKSQKVTIISHHDIQPEMAYEVLEAVLKARGYTLVETLDGNLVRVVPGGQPTGQGGISPDKLEIFSDNKLEPHIGFDNVAIHLVQLQYVAADQAAELLQKVGAPGNQVHVFNNTNMLLIIDTADGVSNMFEVLKKIDVPGYDVIMEIFELKFTRAEALAEQIEQVLGEGSGGSGTQQPNVPRRPVVQPRTTRANVPGQDPSTVVGSAEQTLRVVTDERLNALIVVASEGLMQQVRELIARLDTATPFDSNNMHYVALLHTDAESVAGVLDSVTSVAPREGSEGGAQDGEVKPFEKKVTITPYEENNALVIIASPQDFAVLQELIDQLDTPRKQVNIEGVIMEVTLSDDFSLSFETAFVDESDFFGLANVVDLANVLSAGPGALTGAGGSIGIIDGTTEVTLPGIDGATTTQTVQNVPFLVRALETLTDVEILSRPNLMMKDNTEGQLTVGQEIGIPTSQSDINPSSGFTSRNSLSRRDVGIKLSVTPQINEGDYVSMEIDVESSSTVDSGVGIDPNETGATIAKSNVVSEVVVQSGQTGIIGGLIRESSNRTVSQVPWLGDIPLVGNLFRGRSHGRQKQNLVILVTPRIIDRNEEMEMITQSNVDEFYDYQFDAMFEKGFIKKIKGKHRARHKHRPTANFNRGKNSSISFNEERAGEESVSIEPLETQE